LKIYIQRLRPLRNPAIRIESANRRPERMPFPGEWREGLH
jgi:hypothetical protein